jgi:hypothetical protein
VIWLALLGVTMATDATSDDASVPAPALLEFLGSWGGEDGEWEQFFDSLPPRAVDSPDLVEAEPEANNDESKLEAAN